MARRTKRDASTILLIRQVAGPAGEPPTVISVRNENFTAGLTAQRWDGGLSHECADALVRAGGLVPFVVEESSIDDKSLRNMGLGIEIYVAAVEEVSKVGGALVASACVPTYDRPVPEERGYTSKSAMRVWKSRRFASRVRVDGLVAWIPPTAMTNPHKRSLPLRSVVEGGALFETGVPVEFRFVRNTERSPYFGAKFQQDIEPAGRYMLHQPAALAGELAPGWESGTIRFERPLVLAFNTIPNEFYGDTSWKAALHQAYGKKSLALSNALISDGYDGIVTVGVAPEGHSLDTREIIDLGPIRQRRDQRRARRMSAGSR